MKRYDLALYAILALIFALSCAYIPFAGRGGGEMTLEVVRGGKTEFRAPLGDVPEILEFKGPDGYNIVSTAKGVRMVSADCPGGDCVRAGTIQNAGESIICLPHRLTVRLTAGGVPAADAVSY
ncbi:MAG: NusG domain II-containing protein [Synergistaceae bacterium]|jgi:hypothetical protein|nr:NusG domain II-containing protein [Synergistaceae bacterium]